MKRRVAIAVFGLIVLSLGGAIATLVWPKYGLCFEQSRQAEIACMIRRNLHFSAHLTWAFNRHTLEAARAETSEADIPHLVGLLGHDRPAVRMAAGYLLASFGEPGRVALQEAARSPDWIVRYVAEDVLWTLNNAPPSDDR